MTERNDLNTARIAMVGALGVILSTAVALAAIVAYHAAAARLERSRSDEAAVWIQRQIEQIASGRPVSAPWLDADLQRATQEEHLGRYDRRTVKQADGTQRTAYTIPIGQAMESVLQDVRAGAANSTETGT